MADYDETIEAAMKGIREMHSEKFYACGGLLKRCVFKQFTNVLEPLAVEQLREAIVAIVEKALRGR